MPPPSRGITATSSMSISPMKPTATRSPGSICRSCWRRTLMVTLADREALARVVLAAADRRRADERPWRGLGDHPGQGDRRRQAAPRAGAAGAAAPGAGAGDARRRAGGARRGAAASAAASSSRSIRRRERSPRRYGAATLAEGAHDGHTGAVTAGGAPSRRARARHGMLTLPGDMPLVTAAEIEQLIAAHGPAPAFTIAPAHDDLGSNAILMSPPRGGAAALWRGQFLPASRRRAAQGIEPTRVAPAGHRLGYRQSADLDHFARLGSRTRAGYGSRQHARTASLRADRPAAAMPHDQPRLGGLAVTEFFATILDRAESGERLSDADALALAECDDLPALMRGRRGAARRRPWRARLLFAQGLHPADPAVPRRLPLLHLRAPAAPRRARPISTRERGAGDRPRRRQGRLPRGAVHPRRQAGTALPRGARGAWRGSATRPRSPTSPRWRRWC